MVIRVPDTQDVVSQTVLEDLSMGQLQALALRVVEMQRDKILDPQAYVDFARHSLAAGTDWATAWAAEQPDIGVDVPTDDDSEPVPTAAQCSKGNHAGPTPVVPEEFYDTLPGVVDNMVTVVRIQDAVLANLAQFADRAYRYDRDTVLGIPTGVNLFKNGKRWLADRFQVETRQVSKFYQRAALITAEPATIEGLGKAALLPEMAAAYHAGEIPSENMDRMTLVAKQFYTFYQAVGLSKANAQEVLAAMDVVFTQAAVGMKPQALAAESTKWLNQVAAIVDPDGPPPELRLQKTPNGLTTTIVNGKLHVHIVTDAVNMELIEALILAGLNFRANQDKFRQPNNDETADHDQNSAGDSDENTSAGDQDGRDNTQSEGLFDGADSGSTPYNDEMTAEERLGLFHQRMDEAVNDPETYAETQDGQPVSREQMRKLDPRSRSEKAHDVFMTILKAQGKRSPGAEGMAEYKRAPATLWTVMDYETLLQIQRDRLPEHYQLGPQHTRAAGLAGYDPGPPGSLAPQQPNTDGSLPEGTAPREELGEDPLLAKLPWSPDGAGVELPPKDIRATGRGHPFVSRRFQTGHIFPGAVLQDLCDANVIPAIFNQAGVPLFLGRGKRVFSDDQILAAGMLGGCRGPGCKVPPVWTDGHHGIFWLHGGGTNTTNLILLCNACHTHVHQGVWTPTWTHNGTLYWIPAPWLDPTQTPIRNTYWD